MARIQAGLLLAFTGALLTAGCAGRSTSPTYTPASAAQVETVSVLLNEGLHLEKACVGPTNQQEWVFILGNVIGSENGQTVGLWVTNGRVAYPFGDAAAADFCSDCGVRMAQDVSGVPDLEISVAYVGNMQRFLESQ